jgi:uncharacterized protein involved in outer membrane biogenesis
MKIFLKILTIILVLIIAVLLAVPMVYKPEIIDLAKKELNKNVNAKIDFTDIDLSLIQSFPDFSLRLNGFSIVGKGVFENDTLCKINSINVKIDLLSVFKGDTYKIKAIGLNEPEINLILKNGNTNYDIALASEVGSAQNNTPADKKAFVLAIDKFSIKNGSLNYLDDDMELVMQLKNINHKLSGELSAKRAILSSTTRIAELNLSYEGIKYFNKTAIVYNARIDADLANDIYTLGRNELILNLFPINFEGSFSFVGKDDINLVLSFKSPENNLKNFLSLIPNMYNSGLEGVKTEGDFSLSGNIKGIYNEKNLPSFNIILKIADAVIQYPSLPQAIKDININA